MDDRHRQHHRSWSLAGSTLTLTTTLFGAIITATLTSGSIAVADSGNYVFTKP